MVWSLVTVRNRLPTQEVNASCLSVARVLLHRRLQWECYFTGLLIFEVEWILVLWNKRTDFVGNIVDRYWLTRCWSRQPAVYGHCCIVARSTETRQILWSRRNEANSMIVSKFATRRTQRRVVLKFKPPCFSFARRLQWEHYIAELFICEMEEQPILWNTNTGQF